MKLELCKFAIRQTRFGARTELSEGVLTIDETELRDLVLSDGVFSSVDIGLAHPGESTRIVHVLDAVPIIRKTEGLGEAFSGFFGLPETVGQGVTHMLTGAAVVTCAEIPWGAGGLLIPREGIIDMSGPGAPFSPFSSLHDIVLGLTLTPGYSDAEYDAAVRMCGLKVARHLARVTEGIAPDEIERFELGPVDPSLPKVAYVDQVHSQGLFARTYIYGRNVDAILPTVLHPNEMLDGAVVGSNYVYACYKTPTYLHCLNPVMLELYRGHGVTHNFVGVIVSRGHHYTYAEKVQSASYAAKVAQLLGCDGVIVTWEGGGNSIIEAMATVQKCEKSGIKTVIIAYEFGNDSGTQSVLLDSVPEADAIVSAGSTERAVRLPAVELVLGGDANLRLDAALGDAPMPAAQELAFDAAHILYCSANHTGFGRLAAQEY
jgi:glycine reductase complex component B subunit alpha and beta